MAGPATVDTIIDGTTTSHAAQLLWVQRAAVGPVFWNALSDLYTGANVATEAQNAANAVVGTGSLVVIPNGTSGMVPPAAPTVTVNGAVGTTHYMYFVIAINAAGDAVASPTTLITNGNATLTVTNFNAVSWGAVTGATSYKLVRLVIGGTEGVVATQAGTSFNDQGGAVTSYQYPGTINFNNYPPGTVFLDQRYLPTNQAANITRNDATNGFQTSAFKLGRKFDVGADNGSTVTIEAFLNAGEGSAAGPDGQAVALYVGSARVGGTRPMWGANIFMSTSIAPVASTPNYTLELDTANNSGANATASTPFDALQLVASGNALSRFGMWITRLAAPAQYIDGIHIATNSCSGAAINIDAVATNVNAISANGPVVLSNSVWGDSLTVSGQGLLTKQAAANARLGVISGNPSLILDVTASSQEWVIDNMGSGTLRFYVDAAANNRLTLDNNGQLVTNAAAASTPLTLQHFAAASVPCLKLGSNVTTATTATAGTNGAVPAQVLGYLPIIWVDGTTAKIPIFKN